MMQTDLLKEILKNADAIKAECGSEYLCASHIAAAVADFCKSRYTGFAFSAYRYPLFEDEQLRYLFAKEVKLSAFFKIRLRQNQKAGIQEAEFDLARCEDMASLRGAGMLSADVVFACALRDLHESYRQGVKSVVDNDSLLAALQDADKNVYDYVVDNIAGICRELQKKSDEAAAIRDWKPAAKFAEPEVLLQLAFDGIEAKHSGNITTLKIPKFFGNTNLTLSIHRADGIYYVHDNRCALRYLARTLRSTEKYERAVRKVCHCHRIDKGRITGSFSDVTGFLFYLKDLIFVAQADLYYARAKSQLCFKDKGYVYIPAEQGEPFAEADLMNMLRESVNSYYDEDMGLCCWLKASNSPFQTRYSFLVETLADGRIRFSDKLKGKYEGELLEPCYWYHNSTDISVYRSFLSKLAGRFGGEFDGKDIYLTAKTKDFQSALFRFFQLAVLVSRFGHDIALPKQKR